MLIMMTSVNNLAKLITDSVEQGIAIERHRAAEVIHPLQKEVITLKGVVSDLEEERNILVMRIDQLTRDQWTDIKAVIDHLHPENDLTREKLAEITARRSENRVY